jgi:hypothetical protein
MIDHSVYPITTDDLEKDFVLSERIRIFSWVREKHLDVPEGEASQGFLAFAEQGKCLLPRHNTLMMIWVRLTMTVLSNY